MREHDFQLTLFGKTSFGEPIINGIVDCKQDGSLDELLASDRFKKNGYISTKTAARTVVVVETPTLHETLARRVVLHMDILSQLPHYMKLAKKQ